MTTPTQPLFALLVGIDQYASSSIPPLHGCVNDVDAMEQLLRDRFGGAQANIIKLTNQAATHQAIIDAFRKYLIEPSRTLNTKADDPTPPAFLFHYSGHGSQAPDPTNSEPDQQDETIVPHDSRLPGIYDIKDWELGQLLDELTTYSNNVTVILDCCHAGSGTRELTTNTLAVRRCQPDLRPQPLGRPTPLVTQTRGALSASGWMKAERYVLLAACRDSESANEMVVQEGEDYRQHGALTYFLIKELALIKPDYTPTYREVHQQVYQQVVNRFADQTPQCEGDRNRPIFAGLRPHYEPALTVVAKDGQLIWVDGGLAHGLSDGSELHVYPPATRSKAEAGAPLATLVVQRAGAVKSSCTISGDQVEIPLLARVAIHRWQLAGMRRQIVLAVTDQALYTALQARLMQEPIQNYLEVVSPDRAAEFRVQLVDGQLQIQNGTNRLLVGAYPVSAIEELVSDLLHLVRYFNALELRNPAPAAALVGKVTLSLKGRGTDPHTGQPIAKEWPLTSGGELEIGVEQPIVLEITNHTQRPLYLGLFEFGYEWDIVQWYPPIVGAHEALGAGATLAIGLQAEDEIAFHLPNNLQKVRETFKLIATTAEADFEILTMGALKSTFQPRSLLTPSFADSALNQLFELAMENRPNTRAALKRLRPSFQDDWTTAEVGFSLVQFVPEP